MEGHPSTSLNMSLFYPYFKYFITTVYQEMKFQLVNHETSQL